MSDDRLLRSRDGDPLERELLEAGAEERPSAEARRRTLAALGLTGLGAGATGGAAGVIATPAGRTVLTRIARRMGIGVTVAIGIGLGWMGLRAGTPSASTSPSVSVAVSAAPAAPLAASVQETIAPPASQPAGVASVAPAPSATAPRRAPASATPSANEDLGLAAEVAALERARSALGSGDASQALRALDDYQRAFPRGTLGQEATVLRIEALARSGNAAGARALADRFLAANPSSPYAHRIRHLVGQQDPP